MSELYRVQDFVEDMKRVTERENDPPAIIERCKPLLGRLLLNPDCIPPEFKQRGATAQGRYMLYRAAKFNVNAVVWGPGDGLGAHNHETWGLVGILENELQETRFRRLDDSSVSGLARLEATKKTTNRAADISCLLPADDIHAVLNTTDRNTVDIHVYGRDLAGLERLRFDVEKKTFVTFASPKYDNC